MTEVDVSEPRVVRSVGGYWVVESDDGFRLKRQDPAEGKCPDADAFVFKSDHEADVVADLISRAFQKGFSKGTTSRTIGGLVRVEISGGDKGRCELYRLKDGKRDGGPIEVKSQQELVEALRPFFGVEE